MFRRKALAYEQKCTVLLLVPGEKIEISYKASSTGQQIFDQLVNDLSLLDKDYYGLKLHDQLYWLDLSRPLAKQIKDLNIVVFELRFKYYPAEPALLINESTRYYLYLQLRSDLIEGRLKSDSQTTLAYLIACILQAELGDSIQDNEENYATEYKFVPNQTEELELAAIELHKGEDFHGLEPIDAELNFLKKASHLVTYGIDPCPVKDGSTQNHFLIGVNHRGIATFQDTNFISQISWDEIDRIALDNKLVLVYCCKRDSGGEKIGKSKALFGFKCPTKVHAQYFWKISNEHRFFFTLESRPESPIITEAGGFFKKTHKLKYDSRVERDLIRDQSLDESSSLGLQRSCSLISKSNDESWLRTFNSTTNSQDSAPASSKPQSDYFKEEDEDVLEEEVDSVDDLNADSNARQENRATPMKRNSLCSMTRNPTRTFTRRSTLVTKSDTQSDQSRQSNRIDKKDDDFIKSTIVMILVISLLLMLMFSLNESKRPETINSIAELLNLKRYQAAFRYDDDNPVTSVLDKILARLPQWTV